MAKDIYAGFSFEGAEALEIVLKTLPRRLERDVVNQSAREVVSKVLAKSIKDNIKQSFTKRTGSLLKGVKVKKQKGTHGVFRVFMAAPAYHAHLLEYGTKDRKIKGKKKLTIAKTGPRKGRPIARVNIAGQWRWIGSTGRIKPHPYFLLGIHESKDRAKEYLKFVVAKRTKVMAQKMAADYRSMSKTFKGKLAA